MMLLGMHALAHERGLLCLVRCAHLSTAAPLHNLRHTFLASTQNEWLPSIQSYQELFILWWLQHQTNSSPYPCQFGQYCCQSLANCLCKLFDCHCSANSALHALVAGSARGPSRGAAAGRGNPPGGGGSTHTLIPAVQQPPNRLRCLSCCRWCPSVGPITVAACMAVDLQHGARP